MKDIENMREIERDVLIAEMAKASQIGRSIRFKNKKDKKRFNNAILKSIKRLRVKIDENSIKNLDIR